MMPRKLRTSLTCPICGAEQSKHDAKYKCPSCKTPLRQQLPLESEISYCRKQNAEWKEDGKPYRTYAGYLYPNICLTDPQYAISQYYLSLLRNGISPRAIRTKLILSGGDILSTLDYFTEHYIDLREKAGQKCGWAVGVESYYAAERLKTIRHYQQRAHLANS